MCSDGEKKYICSDSGVWFIFPGVHATTILYGRTRPRWCKITEGVVRERRVNRLPSLTGIK